MDQLIKGFKARVLVTTVEENFDNFASKVPPNDMVYCHKVGFELLDGTPYSGQVCATKPDAPFKEEDLLDIEIKSFTKGIYTFDIHKITPGQPYKEPVPDIYTCGKETATKQPERPISVYLNGTPGEVALRYAVNLHQYRITPSDDEAVIKTATKFKEFLLSNTQ